MDANSRPERSILQKLKDKYRRRGKVKQVARTPHGTRIMLAVTNFNQSSSHSNNFILYKRKIANLLANNTELAKSLETLRLEYARMEQENAAYQRRLNYIPVVGAKLVDVSTNLSLAAGLISETVNMVVGVKRIIFDESCTIDSVLTENSSAKSDQIDYFGLTKTPEDQLLTAPSTSGQNNMWQPRQQKRLDMSTINEVSLYDDTTNVLGHATATYNLADLQELDVPESPAEIEARCAAIIAEVKQTTSTPENKEPENEDELITPKIPILVDHNFFSSNIPKDIAKHLPYKKKSLASDEAMPKNSDKMSENSKDKFEEPIANNVTFKRGLNKSGKTREKPSGKTNNPGAAKCTDLRKTANNYDCNEGVTAEPIDHEPIIADDPSSQNADHPLYQKTFVVQPSISDVEPATKSTALTLKNKKPDSKKMPLKKSRRDTYLVLKNNEDQANVVEAAAVSSIVNLSLIERKLGNTAKDIENIRDHVMSNRQVSADAIVKDKKDKDINRETGNSTSSPSIAPVLKEIPVAVNSQEMPASEVKAATNVETSASVKVESNSDAAVLNPADMLSLTEVIPLQAEEGFLPLASEYDANVQVSHSTREIKDIGSGQGNAKPDSAIVSSEPVSNVNKIRSSKKVDQETIENSIANTHPVSVKKRPGRPSKKTNKLGTDSQETGDKENNAESSETNKIKEKTSEKKQKKTTSSKSCKKNAKGDAFVPTRKTVRQEALINKGKPISQLNSPPTEPQYDTTASTARKRKSAVYDIFEDGLNVVSPCKTEAAGTSNGQRDESLSVSIENRNIPFSLLKASENVPYLKDNDSSQSRKKLKVEARSENNSFVNAAESSSTMDGSIQHDERPQARMSSVKKDTVKTTKSNKKGSSAKGKKKIATAAENKKAVKQPKAKMNIAEKENEMAHLSLGDFHTPNEKVAALKPAKKQNRLPKSALKPRNVKEESTSKQFNAEENCVDRMSLEGRDLNPIVKVNDYLTPAKENLGPPFVRSSFELNSGCSILKIRSPSNTSMDIVVPESIRKSIEGQSSNTPKPIKNSIASCPNIALVPTKINDKPKCSMCQDSVNMEQSRASSSLIIVDNAPRRRKQTMSYREATLRGKLRRP